jgi:hypothetical protein
MKCRHLRWVPHTLAAAQKVIRVELAHRMPRGLAKQKRSHFHFMFTGDESRTFYVYNHRTVWFGSWDDVDEIESRSKILKNYTEIFASWISICEPTSHKTIIIVHIYEKLHGNRR